MIGFKANQIRQVSENALPINTLRWLILTDNQLKVLPDNLGQCQLLQKLMLAGNQLTSLPLSLGNCHRLELLRIAANQLTTFPDWLCALPRLTWLAYAGNPFCQALESQRISLSDTPLIDWERVSLQHQLGQGASGIIYQAQIKDGDPKSPKPVAIKLFKSALTSDGLPQCEINATQLAGKHPHLFGLEGVIQGHPESTPGIVMPLLPAHFKALAAPPSYESCTRDVYLQDQRFSPTTLLRLLRGMASALAHLHARGLMHGDFYGHNMLSDSLGDAVLSDFGAASFLPVNHRALSTRLQQLESRAFGCLLEELLQRCEATPAFQHVLPTLWQLHAECTHHEIAKRPLFNEICNRLQALDQPAL